MGKEIRVKSNIEKLRELIIPFKAMQYMAMITLYVVLVGFIIFLILSPDVRSLSNNLNSISEKVRNEANTFKLNLIGASVFIIVISILTKYGSCLASTKVLKVMSNLREELVNDESNQEKIAQIDLILEEKRLYQYCTFANVFLFKPLKDISK